MILISFLLCLFAFLAIGLASMLKSRRTAEDYLIAGKSVSPLFVGLSAVATNNSGFMFIGMVGVTYATGLNSIWLMVGWVLGDLLVSLLALKPLHQASKQEQIHSYGGLLAHWFGQHYVHLRRLVGALTILCLTVYAAAQLKAGSKATVALLDWAPETGVLISAALVLCYSATGGIRASIWTDVAQSCVMLVSMALLVWFGIDALGGMAATTAALAQVQPGFMNWLPDLPGLGIVLFIVGWLFGGMAVLGQPHIVIRFMSLDNSANLIRMRTYYYLWFGLFYGLTIVVGLLSRLFLTESSGFDAETTLPEMAQLLFSDVFVGLVLAALFAATMSTADSLILACSASLSRDLLPKSGHALWLTKSFTASVLIVAVLLALSDNKTVFALVLDAWGMLGAAFAPLVLVYAFGGRPQQWLAIAMVALGLTAFVVWNTVGLGGALYAAAPGMLAGFAVFALGYRRGQAPAG